MCGDWIITEGLWLAHFSDVIPCDFYFWVAIKTRCTKYIPTYYIKLKQVSTNKYLEFPQQSCNMWTRPCSFPDAYFVFLYHICNCQLCEKTAISVQRRVAGPKTKQPCSCLVGHSKHSFNFKSKGYRNKGRHLKNCYESLTGFGLVLRGWRGRRLYSFVYVNLKSWGSSVSLMSDYRLYDQGSVLESSRGIFF